MQAAFNSITIHCVRKMLQSIFNMQAACESNTIHCVRKMLQSIFNTQTACNSMTIHCVRKMLQSIFNMEVACNSMTIHCVRKMIDYNNNESSSCSRSLTECCSIHSLPERLSTDCQTLCLMHHHVQDVFNVLCQSLHWCLSLLPGTIPPSPFFPNHNDI